MRLIHFAVLAGVLTLAACSDDPEQAAPDASANAGAGAGQGVGQAGLPAPDTIDYFNQVVGDRVFFALDRFDLDAEAQSTLAQQAVWLSQNPNTSVTVEGHADERGTREYNLALGARRANSVRQFLIANGVAANRVETASYGKERPVALCSNESCWSQNRRGVTVVIGAPAS